MDKHVVIGVTDFYVSLQATVILSGGEGVQNLNRPGDEAFTEASLLMWQQTQTWL